MFDRGDAFSWTLLLLLALFIVAGPSFLSPYDLVLGFGFFVAAGLAVSWNFVGGFAGQFALGHAMFVGIGSYSVAVLTTYFGLPIVPALAVGGLLSAVTAAVSAALFLRMRGAYFSVATMGLALVCMAIVIVSPSLGATAGIILRGDLQIDDLTLFRASGGLLLLITAASIPLSRSALGLALMAVRDDEQAAAESGVNPLAVKCIIMGISGGAAGLIGGLVALQKLTVEPYSAFSMVWTIQMIMMSVIGGLGSIMGPLFGAAIMFGLQQALDDLPVWNLLVTATILILIIRLAPGGVVSIASELFARFRPAAADADVSGNSRK